MLSSEGTHNTLLASPLFWCEALCSPTHEIPLPADTIPDVVGCYFRTPSPMPHTICMSLNPEERPLNKRGALLAINPEEMMHADLATTARGIQAGVAISPG